MRENNRKSIASKRKLPQFITMNVIDGQASLVFYSSLIFYSLTIDNILNIIAYISYGKARDLRKLKEAKNIYENLNYASQKYVDSSIIEKLDRLIREAKRDKEEEEEAERRRKRREEEEAAESSSHSSFGSSSHHSGFGGHSGGGGASRGF